MILIAQIILTVVAWKKGWRWFSLIPMISSFFVGFMIGLQGGEISSAALVMDITATLFLIFMVLKPLKNGREN